MKRSRISYIKQAQRTSFLYNELASFFLIITQDNPALASLVLTRVELSDKQGMCTLFFTSSKGYAEFKEKCAQLVLYKSAMRTALSKSLHKRYCPDLIFKYDETLEKVQKIEAVLDSLREKELDNKEESDV